MENQVHNNSSKTLTSYVTGFVLSVVLTVGAYLLVIDHSPTSIFTPWNIGFMIAGLALVQGAVQLIFFMHLRVRTPSRWQFFLLLFMVSVIFILVAGSLWIMYSLNDRMMMSPDQVQTYMQDQAGL